MQIALTHVDAFLHGHGLFHESRSRERPSWWLAALILVISPLYGAMMGSFELDSVERLLQIVYSGVKVPILLAGTSLLCLPAFFVLNTILGLRGDFREALQAILAGQAGLSLGLASLGPLTRLWYFSSDSYRAALLFNAAMFAVATIAGHIVMTRYYRVLIRRDARHRLMLFFWVLLYSFVGIQMGWILRPFIGSPGMRVTFFREEAFTNAYVVVAGLIFGG